MTDRPMDKEELRGTRSEAPAFKKRVSKTTVTVATLIALVAFPYATPRLARYRIPIPFLTNESNETEESSVTEVSASKIEATAPVATVGSVVLAETNNVATVTNALAPTREPLDPDLGADVLAKAKSTVAIEDADHHLDAFWASLAKTQHKDEGAITRILHYGDSVITSDYISGTARRLLQERYGDAGHGFVLIANGWDWYFHNDVVHWASAGWGMSRITGPFVKDGGYGIGGVTFRAWPGAAATFGTADHGDFGRKVSHFDVYYLEQPKGGEFELKSGAQVERVRTAGESKVSRVHSFVVPDGEAKLSLRLVSGGETRLFGVALERDTPGVVYDALGANGARVRLLDGMDGAHWKEQLALRKPALVILSYGTNESEDGMIEIGAYKRALKSVIGKAKKAAPDASVLVMAPLDRAEKHAGVFRSKRELVRLVTVQREVAAETGVAFWNTFAAMGGEGAMGRWVNTSPQLGAWDLTHPTPAGASLVGELFVNAIDAGLYAYRERQKP